MPQMMGIDMSRHSCTLSVLIQKLLDCLVGSEGEKPGLPSLIAGIPLEMIPGSWSYRWL